MKRKNEIRGPKEELRRRAWGWALGLPSSWATFWPLDTGVLVVTEEEAFSAVALVAAHHVDTALLTAAIALGAFIHICAGQVTSGAVERRRGSRVCPGLQQRRLRES